MRTMAYQYHDNPSCIGLPTIHNSMGQNRGSTQNLPYAMHPIFMNRKLDVLIALVGCFLCYVSGSSYYDRGQVNVTILFLIFSALFCATDVCIWATKKAAHPDEDSPWPLRIFTFGDLVLALLLLWIFGMGLADTTSGRYEYAGPSTIFRVYGYLAALVCSAFWKQVMASYRKAWLASQPLPSLEPCQRCGYTYALPHPAQPEPYHDFSTQTANARTPLLQRSQAVSHAQMPQQQRHRPVHPRHLHQPPPPQPPNLHAYTGPSAVLTPQSGPLPSSTASSPQQEHHDGKQEALLIGSSFDEGLRDEDELSSSTTTETILPATRGLPARVQDAEVQPALHEPSEVVFVRKKGGKRREKSTGKEDCSAQ
nr:hypothetical protein CFP56_41291 [Quercus suber]